MQNFLQSHAVFLIPILVSLLTQFTKFVLYSLKHGWNWRYIATHGHMPSSHTAFAISLVTSIGYYEGIGSGAFAVAVGVAFLVIDDALRLRRYLGDQGHAINLMIEQLHLDANLFPRLKERVGHRTNEVIVGGFFGFFLALLFIWLLQ
ncbi:MAG: divergent PAP2 family protein [Candidatus Moraniibacteriota bacterium]